MPLMAKTLKNQHVKPFLAATSRKLESPDERGFSMESEGSTFAATVEYHGTWDTESTPKTSRRH